MKNLVIGSLCLLSIATLTSANPEKKWSIEMRGNMAAPLQDLGKYELNPGFGLETTASYNFKHHMAIYAGWGWQHFSADNNPNAGNKLDFEETGYRFGFQFVHPIGTAKLSYLISAGGVFNHIEAENSDGDIVADTGHGLGGELGAGLIFRISDSWSFMPSVRYQYLPQTIDLYGKESDFDLSYMACAASFIWSF